MKGLKICGWAVIFTVTLLLVACASHSPKVTSTSTMSGPDATMIQPDEQFTLNEDTPMVISQDWLDMREHAVLHREHVLDIRENALAIDRAWHNEREKQLALQGAALERRENALAINEAWLKEHERVIAQQTPEMTKQDDMLTFLESFVDEESRVAGLSMDEHLGESAIQERGGRCYASVFIPAQYRTVAVTKPIELPKGETLPRLYQTVTEQVKVSDEKSVIEEVLCEEKMTSCRITEIQRSLLRGGYYSGPIDGIVGRKTMAALNAFQKDFNLTVTNHLTTETVSALDAYF